MKRLDRGPWVEQVGDWLEYSEWASGPVKALISAAVLGGMTAVFFGARERLCGLWVLTAALTALSVWFGVFGELLDQCLCPLCLWRRATKRRS